jgi:epoxyqueuosine reductase QueG
VSNELSRRLAAAGIAHIGCVSRARFDAEAPAGFRLNELAPGAESLLVAASAGAQFWNAFQQHATTHPGWLARRDPLDDFTRIVVDGATTGDANVLRVFYPFFAFEPRLPFQKLGVLAELGRMSPLGLLVHPLHGPWFALRAAIALAAPIPESPALARACDSCEGKPCIAACPGGAVTLRGWHAAPCAAECRKGEPCASGCDARRACPLGRDFVYPEDAIHHHHIHSTLLFSSLLFSQIALYILFGFM